MEPSTLDRILRRHADERGAKIALREASETLSYAQLEQRARRVARGLQSAGVAAGDRVCYLGKNTLAYFEFFLGAAQLGAVTVPINWRLAPPEIELVLDDARPRMLLVEGSFSSVASGIAAHVARLCTGGVDDTFAGWRDSQPAGPLPGDSPTEDSPVLQMYTSGTTGRAKGVVLTHRTLF